MPSATFTTSGSWSVPPDADPATIQVWAWAEGGNSGSSLSGSSGHSGAGGGSGAIAGEPALGGLTPGVSSLSFTIGTGGTNTDTSVTGGSVAVTAHHGGNASAATAGTAGAAGANTVTIAGSAGGAGRSGASHGGGSGAGSPGSTGSGGAGSTGGAGTLPGGSAGTGAAGPPSLAGAQGGSGGAPTGAGTDGNAPGAGAGGPGNSTSRTANQGAPGQVIIIWAVISGVSLPTAQVTIQSFAPSPGGNTLTVTAAGAGAISPGILLRVLVLDNAALPSDVNTANVAGSGTTATVSITPAGTGSKVYSVLAARGGLAPTAAAGNTALDGTVDGSTTDHGTYVSTSTTTGGLAFTAGGAVSGPTNNSISVAAIEALSYGGTITTDASSPAVATGSTSATTAGFAPPAGAKLILALVSTGATTAGIPGMTLTDSYGLTWKQAVTANANGFSFAGIWYAYTPAALSLTRKTPGNGTAGIPYSYTFAAKGGYGALTWSLATGALPAGLTLSNGGVLSGTPTTAGVSTFTISAVDAFGNSVTSSSLSVVINKGTTPGGVVRATWTGASPAYSYGTLEIPVSTVDHDWIWVSVSWVDGEDAGIAYCADNVQNDYQPVTLANGIVNNQVFAVPNARAASTVYVSTSAYVRWLTACVLDVTGLQPGLSIDALQVYSGSSTTFTETLSTTQPDFVLAAGAFRGVPATVTQSGSGATWTGITWGGINGSSADGLTQSVAWAEPTSSATPAMQFTAAAGNYAGCIVAVSSAAGLPVNPNPAWPVIRCQAAFGYTPQEPTASPVWTDITSRFWALRGKRGRSFELDELNAADMTVHLDNFDGALSPGGSLGAALVTPVQVTATWQGRTYVLFHGFMTALPQTFDFQRGVVRVACTDDFSKLAQILLATCMIQEMLYDKPVSLWPLNEQQGTAAANNWSSRSVSTLVPVAAKGGGGQVPSSQQLVKMFGTTFYVDQKGNFSTLPAAPAQPAQASASGLPSTGFGNQNNGTYPAGLMGTQDSAWGNTTAQAVVGTTTSYQGTALVGSNDSTLPWTSTGCTYSVWTQMFFEPVNSVTGATVLTLTDQNGTGGGKKYLAVYYDGTQVTVSQTAGSHTFSPPSFLFDSGWHLWTVTVSTGGTVTLYLDGVSLGSFAGTSPSGTPTMIQLGGDTTVTTAAGAGIFTGCMMLGGAYDRLVDPERILSWFQSGATGFQDELAGERIQRILAWSRWNGPQAVDPGVTLQQEFNYLTGGYGNNGLTGAIGQFLTAGGSTGADTGSQADSTVSDIANTDNGFVFVRAEGTFGFTERDRISNFPVGLALGDMDYSLNAQDTFDSGLGPWTSTVSCTVAQSTDWSYAGQFSALVTVTGSPATAYAWGDRGAVTPGSAAGFSCWVMSPQGCSVQPQVDWYNASNTLLSTSSGGTVNVPPMTPVFLNLTSLTAPAGAAWAYPHPSLVSSPVTGTQLYFDRARLSPAGFQVPFGEDLELTEDIQYLFNDIAVTRNVDQATYRARDTVSRSKYYPRVYTRTIYSSANDLTAVQDCATILVSAFASPSLRVSRVTVDAAENPEAWPFVLSAGIGDTVPFTRSPVGVPAITGTFMILSVEPDIGQDKAQFTYVLAPAGVF